MNWNYLFKHWFSTIVFTPILIEILEYLESKNYTSKLLLITITVVGILGSFYIFFNNREPKIGLQYIAISIFLGV